MSRFRKLIPEFYRRFLWQVLATYVAGAWVALQVVDVLVDNLGLPEWFPAFAIALLALGLPVVVATALVQARRPGQARAEGPGVPGGEVAPAGESAAAALPGADATRRHLTWRNALLGGVMAFALWGVVAAVWLVAAGPPPRISDARTTSISPNVIAVLPFSVQGGEGFEYLGEGIVNLLSTKLDGAGDYRTADPRTLLNYVQRRATERLDPSTAGEIARHLGAGLLVLGNVVEAGGRFEIAASIYELNGEHPLATAEAGGEATRVFELVDEIAAELLGGLSGEPAARITRIAAVTTHSLSALKAYLEGEQAFREGKYQVAVDAFERAAVEDSTFALAFYRLSIAAEWNRSPADVVTEAAAKAAAHADRLAPHDRELVLAFLATRRGEAAEAERRYRAIVASYPEDLEAWFQLAEVLFHYGPLRGGPITASRQAWEQMLRLAPNEETALIHLARIAATSADTAGLDSLTRKVLELSPGGARAPEMEALRAFALRDSAAIEQVVQRLREAPVGSLSPAVWGVAVYSDNLSGARVLAAVMTEETRPAEVRALGHVRMAMLDAARGRWRSVERELDLAEALAPTLPMEHRAWLSLVPSRPDSTGAMRAAGDRMETWDPETAEPPAFADSWISAHEGVHHHIRLYMLGSLAVRLGQNSRRAERYADRLAELPNPPEARFLSEDFSRAVRARIIAATRPAEALARLEEARMSSWYDLSLASGFISQAHERFLRAELLVLLGRTEEAMRWYSSFENDAIAGLVYLAPSHLRRARLLDDRGDREEAVHHYREFVKLWGDADPELQPQVEAARARLGEILAKTG